MKDNTKILKIIIAFVIGCIVVGVFTYLITKNRINNKNSNPNNSSIYPIVTKNGNVDDYIVNSLLSYVGIKASNNIGTADVINKDLVELYTSNNDDIYILRFINDYALANNLFEAEEYRDENDSECYPLPADGIAGGDWADHCYLLSENNFNKIKELYKLKYSFDEISTNNKVNGYYLYKEHSIMGGIWNDYDYTIKSANYTNNDKTEIVIETTRVTNTNLEKNIANDKILYFFTKDNDNWYIKSIEKN